jgi:hypothetical protein
MLQLLLLLLLEFLQLLTLLERLSPRCVLLFGGVRHELHEAFAISAEQRLDRACYRAAAGLVFRRRVDPERDADVIVVAGEREAGDLRRVAYALVEQRNDQIRPASRCRRERQLEHLRRHERQSAT